MKNFRGAAAMIAATLLWGFAFSAQSAGMRFIDPVVFTALRSNGTEARLCLFHGENHELSRSGKPQHRVRRLTEITEWFEKYAGTEKE